MRRLSIRPGSCPFRLLSTQKAVLTGLPLQSIMTWSADGEDRAGAGAPPPSIKEGVALASAGGVSVEHPVLGQSTISKGIITETATPRPSVGFGAGRGGAAR